MNNLPISAIIVCYNEAHLLNDCLKSIHFCDEIVVIDLYSTDNSLVIAKQWTTQVFMHRRVRIVEIIRAKFINKLKYNWVLIIDPDERLSLKVEKEIEKYLHSKESIGEILAVKQNYFRNIPLKGTMWGGGDIHSRCIVNRTLVNFSENVHQGYQLKKGALSILLQKNNTIHHYWMQNYSLLFEKHHRYILEEGKSKYDQGERYSSRILLKRSILAFKRCFFDQKGYLDGLTGLFLSIFWVWYVFQSWKSLKNYEKELSTNK
jgi:glycosyltransferase involved in cell wall biosynthesis